MTRSASYRLPYRDTGVIEPQCVNPPPSSVEQRIGDIATVHLGIHHPNWLSQIVGRPLFVSHRRLARLKTLPRATTDWSLDSGGFTELSLYGQWRTSAKEYVAAVRRYIDQIGRLAWAASQDLMCEREVLARTGMTIAEHQRLTIANHLELRTMAPDLPFIPVLQGWTRAQYLHHRDAYVRAGIDLTREPLVGLGSVCRRQNSIRVGLLASELAHDGIRLHAFGFNLPGLSAFADRLISSDSLGWSMTARYEPPIPGHTHASCANCLQFALGWHDDVVDRAFVGPRHAGRAGPFRPPSRPGLDGQLLEAA
jgi:hypothetical protein